MKRDVLASLGYVAGALLVLALAYWTGATLPLARDIARPVGLTAAALGGALYAWSIVHLRETFLGNVSPVGDRLVTAGPYRWIRHPNYLATFLILSGLALAARSLWAMVGTFALFLPAAVYRARLEERALAQAFGARWQEYARRARFLVPGLW